jgi:EpsI family protein
LSTQAISLQDRRRLPHAIVATLLMVGALFTAVEITPSRNWFDEIGRPDLDVIVPHQFGDWQDLGKTPLGVVDPEQAEQLRIIYTQTLTRAYRHIPTGRVVMLSLAHGADQTYATQLHRPEMCYRAQGFTVTDQSNHDLVTRIGTIKTTRLRTHAGSRNEPVTYWVRTGDRVTQGSLQMNLARLGLALHGFIADGVLFRVSEVTSDEASSFQLQSKFMSDLLEAVPSVQRSMLIGSNGA